MRFFFLFGFVLVACNPDAGKARVDVPLRPPGEPNGERAADAMENSAQGAAELDTREPAPPADSLGPQPMDYDSLSFRELKASLAKHSSVVPILNGHGLRVWEPDEGCSRFYYRATLRDTLWRRLSLNYRLLTCGGITSCGFEAEWVEWDGRPPREVLLRMEGRMSAPATEDNCAAVQLISVAGPPRVLLQASTRYETYSPHVESPEEEACAQQGWERSVHLRQRDVVLGAINQIGKCPTSPMVLTQLAAGRYRYHQSKVFRVGK